MSYRKLTQDEISVLENQGCRSSDWTAIEVKDGFKHGSILNTSFEGKVCIGRTGKILEIEKGISSPSGISNSSIKDCEIGDDVYISNVSGLVGYNIGNEAVIENVGTLQVNRENSFGNGTEIEILNEGGGREIPIFDRLSSQIAYLFATCRHDAGFIKSLSAISGDYIKSKSSETGQIGKGARISNTKKISNVMIGDNAIVADASLLENGTIASKEDVPAIIGADVICKNFIIHTGSTVDTGAILDNCFVGQGVKIGKQFSAENSAFFANSEGFHGEAVCVFGGPYTVTHHKSTLLIAGMYSFFNAGSGTNASNHLYKLGPLHQGIMERGCKTGSFSYTLWPCRIGCFTAIIGKHYSNFDTSEFPFSYINEVDGKSWLTPALNLFTVGTRRDSVKWPKRDRRTDDEKLDLINFNLFNPYTVGKIVAGIKVLNDLYENTPKERHNVTYKGIGIKRLMLKASRKYYEIALKIYFGEQVISRLENCEDLSSLDKIRSGLSVKSKEGKGLWVDAAGMLLPQTAYNDLIDSVKNKKISSLQELENKLQSIFNNYDEMEWAWCAELIREIKGIDVLSIDKEQLVVIINHWKTNSEKLNNMILQDAEKEFDSSSRIGFGLDGDDSVRDADFESVRGTIEANSFVTGLQEENRVNSAKADALLNMISSL